MLLRHDDYTFCRITTGKDILVFQHILAGDAFSPDYIYFTTRMHLSRHMAEMSFSC